MTSVKESKRLPDSGGEDTAVEHKMIKLLAPELYFFNFSTPVNKM